MVVVLMIQGLLRQLERHWQEFDPKDPPSCFSLSDTNKDNPHVWIHPSRSISSLQFILLHGFIDRSVILQVRAAQIVVSDKYGAGSFTSFCFFVVRS